MAFKPPRTVFLDFPLGCPAGKPNAPEMQRAILRAALTLAPAFAEPWRMEALPFQWSADGGRQWEKEVKEMYRRGLSTVSRHVSDHQNVGESLLDKEKEFSLRCQC
ncbi:MAG TPA: hypothetical protein VMR20_17155 [Verrucomicrobiae bacterium]|nr:hypothetical protein [Verrucomicrobiae bacterium]